MNKELPIARHKLPTWESQWKLQCGPMWEHRRRTCCLWTP